VSFQMGSTTNCVFWRLGKGDRMSTLAAPPSNQVIIKSASGRARRHRHLALIGLGDAGAAIDTRTPLANSLLGGFPDHVAATNKIHALNFERWNVMRWMMLAVLVGTMGSAAAQPADSIVATGPLLMGCRALVENDPNGNQMQMGACAGAIRATVDISRTLRRACPSAGNVVIEAARAVIMFVDERPERKSEEFGPLALTAIGYKWPC